jgi:hypothetical protein
VTFAVIIVGLNGNIKIPSEYINFENLFREEKNKEVLPKYRSWNHEIPLIEGKTPTALPIYSLSKRELETLRKYINKNLIKEYIRSSKSPIKFTILFVPKKNRKLRIYVNYKKLNNIIIKNRYTLPLIYEI